MTSIIPVHATTRLHTTTGDEDDYMSFFVVGWKVGDGADYAIPVTLECHWGEDQGEVLDVYFLEIEDRFFSMFGAEFASYNSAVEWANRLIAKRKRIAKKWEEDLRANREAIWGTEPKEGREAGWGLEPQREVRNGTR